ncbi:uncharacterized protein LOC130749718 [Lotus japonicus]|uniref:uncharacterized protein LOC130749718 n=1 Tax=Lotus japonicus TaxID=34305 RepID=UPI0025825E52|nr:uncharacterized protein LOC130749718 [Lotus japonicus]
MTVIYNQTTYFTISEVEAMVISHEARFDRMRKKQLADTTPAVFLAQAQNSPSSSTAPAPPPPQAMWTQPAPAPSSTMAQPPATSVAPSQPVDTAVDSGYGNRDEQNRNSGGYGRGRGRGRGRNVQCTYCSKWGHDAASCWSRPSGVSSNANSSANSAQSGNSGSNFSVPGVNLGFSPMQFGGFPSMANFGFPPYAPYNSMLPQYGSSVLSPSSMPPWSPWCIPPTPYSHATDMQGMQAAGMSFVRPWLPQGQFPAPTAQTPQFPRPPQQQVSTGMHPQAMLATVPAHHSSPVTWCPDSGATHHVTNNPGIFVDHVPSSSQEQLLVGNGQGLPIQSIGHL